MKRRNFIQTAGLSLASVIVSDSLLATSIQAKKTLINLPDEVSAIINGQSIKLIGKGKQTWTYQDVVVTLINTQDSIRVEIQAPKVSLSEVSLFWKIPQKDTTLIMNDHWERTYGDISWHKPITTEILPWYFMEYNQHQTNGFGVKTGTNAFCFWQVSGKTLSLTLDTRSGGDGVQLGDRKLQAAEIVTLKSKAGETAFQATRRFMSVMCAKARMPKQPVYGINDWYFSYGNNSDKLILEHTELMAPMAEGLSNRPFSVVDAGWFIGPPSAPNDCCWGDRMDVPNAKFKDMAGLTDKIRKTGMRPGIWTRPLCGSVNDAKTLILPLIKGREINKPVLDPSIPENLERIKSYFKLYKSWGYEMIKFDFTSYDIFGKWGFEMLKEGKLTDSNWRMYDNTKTNAEIINTLYQAIREASGETYIIGCNTISHLSAGLFELNRIGDDTSGKEWDRTRKMGVNTLAFRGVQHGTFYAADGDCVGLTNLVPWEKNKQWMQLVAKSGTPLFISAQPEATGTAQKAFIKESFRWASQNLPVGEPLDWQQNAFPTKWKLNGKIEHFNWD